MVISSTTELVFIPTPAMGHILSSVEVAKRIIERDQRISILIVIINFRISSATVIDAFLDSQSRDNPYPTRLTFLSLPPLSIPPEPSSSKYLFQTYAYLDLYKPIVKQAIEERLRAGSPALSGFILDLFCTTMGDIAADFGVPSYVFFVTGASLVSLCFHFQSLADDKGVDIITEFGNPEAEFDVPGFVNRVSRNNIPPVFIDNEGGTSITLDFARNFRKSKGILVNTYVELETNATKALFQLVDKDCIPPIYPVGPILELDNKSRNGSQGEDHSSIMQWLDDQPSSSVVFLCFGSMGNFDADQVKEIANGLEKSGYGFLWSLRKPPAEGKTGPQSEHDMFIEALPEGFLDRTSGRGKIIGWAPQVSILGHPAVGGFVSHCGWNSTLESLWFGVPIATWPLYAEQQLNAFQLVKELGLAVEIKMEIEKGNFLVPAEKIENGVKKLMGMDEETKKRVREMRDKGRKALEDGGSSHEWLGRFVEDVLSNVG